MRFSVVAEMIFVYECAGESEQPEVIVETLAQPYAAGVISVRWFITSSIGRRREIRRGSVGPVACVE